MSWLCCEVDYDLNVKRMVMYINVPYYEEICNVLPHLYELWWKGLYSYNSYWDIDDDDYTRVDPMA